MNTATFGWGILPPPTNPPAPFPAKSSENNQKLFETVRNGEWFLAYRERPSCKTFARTVTHTQQGTHKRTHYTHRALILWHQLALQPESVADVAILSAGIQSWYKNKAETKEKTSRKSCGKVTVECALQGNTLGAHWSGQYGLLKGIAEVAEAASVTLL